VANQFRARGYTTISHLLDPGQVAMASAAMDVSLRQGALKPSTDVAGAFDEYSPIFGELLLRHCRTAVEQAVGAELVETYAFWRIYTQGCELAPHEDREACEVTVSVTIASDPAGNGWPFGLCDLTGETAEVDLPPGDAILIEGHKITHWRKPLTGEAHKQLFLHYVLKDGGFAEYAFDRRSADKVIHKSSV
jgi:hypothetical protein